MERYFFGAEMEVAAESWEDALVLISNALRECAEGDEKLLTDPVKGSYHIIQAKTLSIGVNPRR